MADGLLPDALRSSPCTLSAAFVSHEMGGISPSPQINTPGDRTPVAPVPQVCHRPGAVRACAQRAHGAADYHLFSIWRCWPFAALLANAPERRVRCADRERHRESRPRGERMRVSTARRRGGVRERCGEAFARQRAVRRTAAIVERKIPFRASFARGLLHIKSGSCTLGLGSCDGCTFSYVAHEILSCIS